jgi:hypothetical protein
MMFGHMTILWDIVLAFGIRPLERYWRFTAATILMLDTVSITVTAVEVRMEVITRSDVGWTRLCADCDHRGKYW